MTVTDAEEATVSRLRTEIRQWLSDNWEPDLNVGVWWERIAEAGWSFPEWPKGLGGRDLTHAEAEVVNDEMTKAGVLGPPAGAGPAMGAPIIFEYGSKEQKERWLPPISKGLEAWGQFFSEPGAGSDLASVQTKAVRDGDEWIINGQKVWNSGTFHCDRALLVARTDSDLPKHKGISFFIIDVHQPGIEIRPIKQMNGAEEFNEAFFSDARVSDASRIGEINQGWAVAMHVLAHERANHAGGGDVNLHRITGGKRTGVLDLTVSEGLQAPESANAANRLPIFDMTALTELAKTYGRLSDPVIRQRMAHVHAFGEALRFTVERANASSSNAGTESSVAYLGAVRLVRLYRDLVADIAGPYAMLDNTPVAESILTAPCHGIQGGSEQIQMNVIGERILGLPKEPSVDRNTPFKDLRVGTQQG